jgi:arylsulfatase A-like enzyme
VQRPWDYGAATIQRESVRQLREAREPVFLFTNFMQAHTPHQQFRGCDRSLHGALDGWTTASVDLWEVNIDDDLTPYEEYLYRFRGLYDGSIDYLDPAVTLFVDAVQAATSRETTVVVTADHGENPCYPAEGGLLGHTASLSEALLQVPLLVLNAPGEVADRVERGYVSHLNLPGLITGLASEELPSLDPQDGRSRTYRPWPR